MSRNTTEFRCLLISPSDVDVERAALSTTVQKWNALIGKELRCRVELVGWETHCVPELGDEAQAIINTQVVDDCDLAIAVFWSRIGTPTAAHDSGSLEEIDRLEKRGCRVMVYFKTAAIPQKGIVAGFTFVTPLVLTHPRVQRIAEAVAEEV